MATAGVKLLSTKRSCTIPDDDDDGGGGGGDGDGDGGGLKSRTRLTSLEYCFLRQPIIGSCLSAIGEGVGVLLIHLDRVFLFLFFFFRSKKPSRS